MNEWKRLEVLTFRCLIRVFNSRHCSSSTNLERQRSRQTSLVFHFLKLQSQELNLGQNGKFASNRPNRHTRNWTTKRLRLFLQRLCVALLNQIETRLHNCFFISRKRDDFWARVWLLICAAVKIWKALQWRRDTSTWYLLWFDSSVFTRTLAPLCPTFPSSPVTQPKWN